MSVSAYGKEFDDAMKVLKEKDKGAGVMRSWYCRECDAFYADKGKPGCAQCAAYENATDKEA